MERRSLSKRRDLYLKTKNQKTFNLIIQNRIPYNTNLSFLITNLSNYNHSNQQKQQLKLGLYYCFLDEKKEILTFIAANLKSLADNIKQNVDHKNLEHVHKFLRGYTVIITNNIYSTKDYTYYSFQAL